MTEQQHPTDGECLARVRAGVIDGYAVLYERHHAAGLAIAHQVAGSGLADDLVAEAFARTLAAIQRGKGPDSEFLPYLARAIRNTFWNSLRQTARVIPLDVADLDEAGVLDETTDRAATPHPWDEINQAKIISDAFRSLPERWRAVLWLTAVEGRPHDEVAQLISIRPPAVAQLAYRAREALRLAYLSGHVQEPSPPDCRRVTELLPGLLRGGGTKRALVQDHLESCPSCAEVASELREVASGLRVPPPRSTAAAS